MINLPVAKEFGLVETKAQEISEMFVPMLNKVKELEEEYNNVVAKEITPATSKEAKTLRLKYTKTRTAVAAIHKDLKKFYLNGGKFVDGFKNAFLMAVQGNEEKLKEIEKHAEIEAQKIINALQLERGMELEKYEIMPIPGSLGEMKDDMWNAYLIGVKSNYEAIKEAERKAEFDRLEAARIEMEEQQRIKAENEKLKAEQAELKAKAEAERKAREKKENEERKIREERERAEKAKHELELARERAEKAKIEAELKAKAEAERKELARIEAEKQAELSKGDSAKVQDMIADLEAIINKYKFDSELNKTMFSGVCNLISKVIAFINK